MMIPAAKMITPLNLRSKKLREIYGYNFSNQLFWNAKVLLNAWRDIPVEQLAKPALSPLLGLSVALRAPAFTDSAIFSDLIAVIN